MKKQAWYLSIGLLLSLSGCVSSVGPFVNDVRVERGELEVVRCFIDKSGDMISKGACTTKKLKLPGSHANRGPKYLYLPNAEVGEVSLRKKDSKIGKIRTSTFSYTASPGLVYMVQVKLKGDRVIDDSVRVSIALDSTGKDQLTGATDLVMVVNGEAIPVVYMNWKRRKRGDFRQETLNRKVSAKWLVHSLQNVTTLELQFGKRKYALHSEATKNLKGFMGYVGARLPVAKAPQVAATR